VEPPAALRRSTSDADAAQLRPALETIRIAIRKPTTTPRPTAGLLHTFRVPEEGTFSQLRHDFESAKWNYRPRTSRYDAESLDAAGPETVGFQPFQAEYFVPLTEEMQWFQFNLLARANPSLSTDELKARWRALTAGCRVFTEGHSIDYGNQLAGGDPSRNYADYILEMNLDNPQPIAWRAISTGGNLVRLIESPTTIEAIDFTKPLPSVSEVWEKPWLIHWATEETLDPLPSAITIDGEQRQTWRVRPFPHMRPVGTPFPIWGRGGRNRIASAASLKSIANGQTFSPYVP